VKYLHQNEAGQIEANARLMIALPCFPVSQLFCRRYSAGDNECIGRLKGLHPDPQSSPGMIGFLVRYWFLFLIIFFFLYFDRKVRKVLNERCVNIEFDILIFGFKTFDHLSD
jgi:hypothetical protein